MACGYPFTLFHSLLLHFAPFTPFAPLFRPFPPFLFLALIATYCSAFTSLLSFTLFIFLFLCLFNCVCFVEIVLFMIEALHSAFFV